LTNAQVTSTCLSSDGVEKINFTIRCPFSFFYFPVIPSFGFVLTFNGKFFKMYILLFKHLRWIKMINVFMLGNTVGLKNISGFRSLKYAICKLHGRKEIQEGILS
jgi:hypothetical protein